jgi:tyrosinase
MAVVRANILTTPHAATYLSGVVALSQRATQATPAALNQRFAAGAPGARIVGAAAELNRPLSWWDLFCYWHVLAMSTPAGTGNRAHGGPVFLPWHRMYLRRLEEAIQLVTGDDGFALPYWDWAADGELAPAAQPTAQVWDLLGGSDGIVQQGALAGLRVRLYRHPQDQRLYVTARRPIWRTATQLLPTLPDRGDEAGALRDTSYDQPGWDPVAVSFRNKVEGFRDPMVPPPTVPRVGPWMHNRVHVWVAGDMLPGSSPNDPVFYLNHCNVDRLWEAWMGRHGRTYAPKAGEGPVGHRPDEDMVSIVWPAMRPEQVLDPTGSGLDWYRYDQLP